ncbi:MAG: gliding motility-associated C-terminal domain-containing protein [Saprospiraceae bacterium]
MKNWATKRKRHYKMQVRYTLTVSLFIVLFVFAKNSLQAQVQAPNFLCIKNDTLQWDVPVNTCGTFISYIVYTSLNQNGPYSPLDTITNANQTSYFHENAGTNRRFYYLQSRYNCPGQPILSSDTLDNRIPEPPSISSVSVEPNGYVRLNWVPSPSPEAYAYVISKNLASGTTIIDTVVNGITYLDSSARGNERVETYYVTTLDRCGNGSLIPPAHSTLLLKATGASACDRTVKLDWALYRNWQNPIGKHEILVSENGGTPRKVGEVTGTATTYTYQNAGANIEYCFSVRAVESNTENIAVSSQSCLRLDVVPGITQLVATNVSVTPENQVAVSWIWNTDAQLKSVLIQRSTNGNTFTNVNTQTTPPTPLNFSNILNDNGANPGQGVVYYQIKTQDACNAEVTSNRVATIFLESAAQGTAGNNVLRWTSYINENATNLTYELYRVETNAAPTLIATTDSATREFTDNVDLNNPGQAAACYYVLAKARITLPDGKEQEIQSRSNTACSSQDAKVYIPNAFAPNGTNREFRPYLQFGEPATYSMSIFDRWGNLIFETRDFSEGWDGRSRGKDAPQGTYTYLIRIAKEDGATIQKAGTVLLVR